MTWWLSDEDNWQKHLDHSEWKTFQTSRNREMSVLIKNLTDLEIDINNLTGAWEPTQSLQPDLALVLKVSYLTVCVLGLGINLLLLTIIVGRLGVETSHWSRYCALIGWDDSLVEFSSRHPNTTTTRGISCLSLCLYGICVALLYGNDLSCPDFLWWNFTFSS